MIISFTDYWLTNTLATTGVGSNPGDYIIKGQPLHPSMIKSSRLANFAKNFEFFWFTDFQVHFAPDAASTDLGSMVGYFDPDPADLPPDSGGGDGQLEVAMGHGGEPAVVRNWAVFDIHQHGRKAAYPVKDFYIQQATHPALACQQGKFYLMCATTPSAARKIMFWVSGIVCLYNAALDDALMAKHGDVSLSVEGDITTATAANPLGTSVPAPATPYDTIPDGIVMGNTSADFFIAFTDADWTAAKLPSRLFYSFSHAGAVVTGGSWTIAADMDTSNPNINETGGFAGGASACGAIVHTNHEPSNEHHYHYVPLQKRRPMEYWHSICN
jgi:hypothetical protein